MAEKAVAVKEQPDREKEIATRLKEIAKEEEDLDKAFAKHLEGEAKAQELFRSAKKNLDEQMALDKKKVDEFLDEHFAVHTSAGKLVDKVLQAELKSPRITHLQETVERTRQQVTWHGQKKNEILRRKKALGKERNDLVADRNAIKFLERLRELADTMIKLEKEKFIWLKADLRELRDNCAALTSELGTGSPSYTQRIKSAGGEEFEMYLAELLKDPLGFMEFLIIAGRNYMNGKNPFYHHFLQQFQYGKKSVYRDEFGVSGR